MVDFFWTHIYLDQPGFTKIHSYFQTDKQQETSQKNKSKDTTGLNIVSINYQLPESEICYMYLSKLGSTTDIKYIFHCLLPSEDSGRLSTRIMRKGVQYFIDHGST